MAGVRIFFVNFDPIFHQFFINKRANFFFQKTFPGLLDNTFLHKLRKFQQNCSSGIRKILTTGRSLAGNGLAVKTTKLRYFWIFLLQNYMKTS